MVVMTGVTVVCLFVHWVVEWVDSKALLWAVMMVVGSDPEMVVMMAGVMVVDLVVHWVVEWVAKSVGQKVFVMVVSLVAWWAVSMVGKKVEHWAGSLDR